MPLNPKEINSSRLPVGVRGYRRDATDELLKRVAWDYSQTIHERETLARELEELKQRNEKLEAETAALHDLIARSPKHDEVGRALVANAQRAARELREATRAECESILKKVRAHAAEHEHDVEARLKSSEAEIEQLLRIQGDLRAKVRSTLVELLQTVHSANGHEGAVANEGARIDSLFSR